MTPLKLSTVWHRRFYEVSFIISLAIAALFVLGDFTPITPPKNLTIDLIPGILALLATVASVVFFFIIKKISNTFIPSLVVYILLTISVGLILLDTGLENSPFIVVWAVLAFSAGVFGAFGWVGILALTGVAYSLSYLGGDTNIDSLLQTVLASVLPAIAGAFIWREDKSSEDEARRNAKTLASELSEVAAKSEIIINAIGDGVMAIDGKGIVELINPAAQKILGWAKSDAVMLNYKSILKLQDENHKDIDPSQDPVQQVLNTNQQTRGGRLTALTQSGKRVSISVVVSPIGDPGSGVIAVFRDVTKERAEEREQAEFISTASHEMRTPVASIEGYLGLAMNPSTAQIDDRARGFIAKAQESAQHLGRLFQDLLDVSKSEDGRMTSVPKVVDVSTIAQTVAEGLAMKAQEKGLSLVFKPSENAGQKKIMPVLYVNQDNDHIREILDNLVENGIKYTPKGEVVVDVQGTEDKVIVSVKDSGLGIPAEDMPHLFQKFYRVDNVDRQEIGGTGLGLYLSRRLAESMQGRIWAESTYGKGSTFFLELPRIDSAEAAQLKHQQESQLTQASPQTPQTQAAEFVPDMTPMTAQQQQTTPVQPQPQPTPRTDSQRATEVRPATTVPRGESLSEEQKAARVKQLEELARQQREAQS